MRTRLFLTALFLGFLPSLSCAAIPRTLPFQGILKNPTTGTFYDGPQSVRFRLYDTAGGNWSATDEYHYVQGTYIYLNHKPVIPADLSLKSFEPPVTYTYPAAYDIFEPTLGVLRIKDKTLIPDGRKVYVSYQSTRKTLWEETRTIPVSKGLFSTVLGDNPSNPFSSAVFFDEPYWVGIKVGTDPEMVQPIPLTSVAYAVTSSSLAVPVKLQGSTDWPNSLFTVENNSTKGSAVAISASGKTGVYGWVPNENHVIAVYGDAFNSVNPDATGVLGATRHGIGVQGWVKDGGSGYAGIFAGGNVGIGTDKPAYPLEVVGDINATQKVRAAGYALTSDGRFKTDVAPVTGALDKVLSLRGVSFNWNREQFPDRSFPEGRQVGFIAQEVEKVIPEVVDSDRQGYKGLSYQSLIPVLVEAIKAQQKEIEELKAEVSRLKD